MDRLNAASVKVLGSREMQALAEAQGLNIRSSTPEYINQLVRSEYERWKKVAADAGLQQE